MIFVLSLLAIFVLVSIYFFFRAEKLQQALMLAKRDAASAQKENKALVDTLMTVSSRYEEFALHRLQTIKEKWPEEQKQLEIMTPLIKNYSLIFRESMKGPAQLKVITHKCYESFKKDAYKEFTTYIGDCESHIKRMWTGNNLNGFVSLVEALLYEQNKLTFEEVSKPVANETQEEQTK